MTTDPEATTIETLQNVNPGDILEVLPTQDDTPHEPQYIRVSRTGDTGVIGEYVDINTGEVANVDVLAVLLAPHGLYSGYRKTVYLGEISHEGTLPKGTYKETIPVYVTLAKEGEAPYVEYFKDYRGKSTALDKGAPMCISNSEYAWTLDKAVPRCDKVSEYAGGTVKSGNKRYSVIHIPHGSNGTLITMQSSGRERR